MEYRDQLAKDACLHLQSDALAAELHEHREWKTPETPAPERSRMKPERLHMRPCLRHDYSSCTRASEQLSRSEIVRWSGCLMFTQLQLFEKQAGSNACEARTVGEHAGDYGRPMSRSTSQQGQYPMTCNGLQECYNDKSESALGRCIQMGACAGGRRALWVPQGGGGGSLCEDLSDTTCNQQQREFCQA